MPSDPRDHAVLDEIHRIRGPRIFGNAVIVVIRHVSNWVENNVLQHTPEADRIPNLGFVLLRQLDALGVTSTFEVEYSVPAPAMLVITNEPTRGIGRECRLACA